MKIVPAGTPVPPTLQTTRVLATFVKVAVVWTPAVTVTVAVPAARLVLTSDADGEAIIDVNVVPAVRVSVITAGPAVSATGVLQAPAATLTGVPAMLKVKMVPAGTPAPPTLQTRRVPVVGFTVLVKVAVVWAPTVTVTVAVPAARLVLASAPIGKVVTDVNVVPAGRVSVMVAGPAVTTTGVLQGPPASTVTGVPATLNVKGVPAGTPVPPILQT